MGLFDALFGTSSKATSNTQTTGSQVENQSQTGTSNTSQNTNQNNTSTSNTNTSQNTTQNTAGTSIISTLSPEAQQTLLTLLPQLTQNASTAIGGGSATNSSALQQIAAQLTQKAGTDAAALPGVVIAGQNEATRAANSIGGVNQVANQTSQAIGSKGNTFAQGVTDQAHNDLITQLQGIAAQSTVQNEQQVSSDLTGAASVLGTASGAGATDANTALAPLISALNALKGASTTSTTGETTTAATAGTSDTSSLQSILSQILGTNNTTTDSSGNVITGGTSATQGKQSSTPGVIPAILSLFG